MELPSATSGKWLGLGAVALLAAALAQPACSESDPASDDDDGAGATTSTTSGSGGGPVGGSGGGGEKPLPPCLSGTYGNVPAGECDVYMQDCPPAMGCEVVSGQAQCVPDTGVKENGDPCIETNACKAGLYCVFGYCAAVCCTGNGEPCGGAPCNVNVKVGTAGGVDLLVRTCLAAPTCELFVSECPENTYCYPLLDLARAVCVPSIDEKGEGEDCGSLNECLGAMVCASGVCRYACKIGSTAPAGEGGCPSGQTCKASGDNPPPGIGVCS